MPEFHKLEKLANGDVKIYHFESKGYNCMFGSIINVVQ